MRVLGHVAISVTIGSILYNYSHSIASFLVFLIAGIFADADHYIDYVREKGLTFNLMKVHDACKYDYMNFRKIVVFLHSYELVILLWLAIIFFDLNIIWKYAAIGLGLHIVTDQVFNPVFPFSYFFCFRLANNFETKRIFGEREVGYARRHR